MFINNLVATVAIMRLHYSAIICMD